MITNCVGKRLKAECPVHSKSAHEADRLGDPWIFQVDMVKYSAVNDYLGVHRSLMTSRLLAQQ